MESAKNEPQMPKAVAGAVGKAKESSAGGSDNGWVRGWFSNSPSQTKSDVFESSGIPVTVSVPDGKGSYASVEEALAIHTMQARSSAECWQACRDRLHAEN